MQHLRVETIVLTTCDRLAEVDDDIKRVPTITEAVVARLAQCSVLE